ncbi:PaaI family thioesterase [Chachezhania antarctica]|uniref:PaaI family thioesterase n=1 Tax=Chachezhania antarctica TaxID=2340860 RepID=UPI000EAEDDD3|nr:PaaI family thioesterase [Chachezhania antarctica]
MPSAPPEDGLIIGETGAQKLVGYVVDVSHADGRARTYLDIDDRHLNRHGVLHGGIISMVLDNVCGVSASLSVDASGTAPFLSLSMTTQYLAAAHPGKVTAIGTITGGGRSTLFIEGELRDADGKLLATSSGVYKRVPQDKLKR